MRVRRDYGDIPIYITENGAAFDDGDVVDGTSRTRARWNTCGGHLAALRRAIADGVDVRRYFAWSLLDNFEWEHGYGSASGSCTSTTRRSAACPSAAPSGTATTSRGRATATGAGRDRAAALNCGRSNRYS